MKSLKTGVISIANQYKLLEELEAEFSKTIIVYYLSEFDVDSDFIKNILKKGKLILNLVAPKKK